MFLRQFSSWLPHLTATELVLIRQSLKPISSTLFTSSRLQTAHNLVKVLCWDAIYKNIQHSHVYKSIKLGFSRRPSDIPFHIKQHYTVVNIISRRWNQQEEAITLFGIEKRLNTDHYSCFMLKCTTSRLHLLLQPNNNLYNIPYTSKYQHQGQHQHASIVPQRGWKITQC